MIDETKTETWVGEYTIIDGDTATDVSVTLKIQEFISQDVIIILDIDERIIIVKEIFEFNIS